MPTWTCFSCEFSKTSPTLSLFSQIQRMTVTCTNAGSSHCRRPSTYRLLLEWLLLKSIDDSQLPLYGQGDFRFMRKVKVYYSSMAAKGLSHFFQKDKVDKIATRSVCSDVTVGKYIKLTSFPHDNCVCFAYYCIVVQHLYMLISVGILRHFASQSRYHLLCVIFQTFRPKRKLEEGTLRYELHKQSKVPFIKHGN